MSLQRGVSRAERNRAIRREALREQLANQGHLQHVVEIAEKLLDLDQELDNVQVQRLSKVLDVKLKLLAKVLPDDKEPTDLNLGGQEDNQIKIKWQS